VAKKSSVQSSRFDSASDFSDSDPDVGLRRAARRYVGGMGARGAANMERGRFILSHDQPQGSLEDRELSLDSYNVSRADGDATNDGSPYAQELLEFHGGCLDDMASCGENMLPSALLAPTGGSCGNLTQAHQEGTIGELRVPNIRSDALASPLGSVPSLNTGEGAANAAHPGLGVISAGDGDFLGMAGAGGLGSLTVGWPRSDDKAADGRSDCGLALGAEAMDGDFMSGNLDDEVKEALGDSEEGLSSELTAALQQLTPEEVERRRQRMSTTYR